MSMTIDEAIRRLDAEVMLAQNGGKLAGADAIRLGIEALKWIKDVRHIINTPNPEFLPGETED